MALVAKEPLYIGFTLAAMPGNLVSPDAVAKYGWEDKVEDDGKELPPSDAADPDADAPAAKKRASK